MILQHDITLGVIVSWWINQDQDTPQEKLHQLYVTPRIQSMLQLAMIMRGMAKPITVNSLFLCKVQLTYNHTNNHSKCLGKLMSIISKAAAEIG